MFSTNTFILLSGALMIQSADPRPVYAQDVSEGAAGFGAQLAADIEAVSNVCSQFYFVNPRIVDEIQGQAFSMMTGVSDRKAKDLLHEKIVTIMKEISDAGEEVWCKSARNRMKKIGGPFANVFLE